MDVALVTGDTDRSPTFAPTYEKHISSEQSSQSPITGTVLAIFIPVIAVIFGIIATIGYILFRHKGDLSRTFSYDRSNVIYIPRKQAKQIHCVRNWNNIFDILHRNRIL